MINSKTKDPFYIIFAIILISFLGFAKFLPFLYLPLNINYPFVVGNLPMVLLIAGAINGRNKLGLALAALLLLGFELYLVRGIEPPSALVGLSTRDLYNLIIRFVLLMSGHTTGAIVGHYLLPKLTHPEDKQWLNVILIFLVVGLAAFATVLINVDKMKARVLYLKSIGNVENRQQDINADLLNSFKME